MGRDQRVYVPDRRGDQRKHPNELAQIGAASFQRAAAGSGAARAVCRVYNLPAIWRGQHKEPPPTIPCNLPAPLIRRWVCVWRESGVGRWVGGFIITSGCSKG